MPAISATTDTSPASVGLLFYSEVSGRISAIRFYKGVENTGTHIGQLWSLAGQKLAEVTFSNESASGWQQALLPSPVGIDAWRPYVVSYLAPYGRYAVDATYAWNRASAGPLRVFGVSALAYGVTAQFPGKSWSNANYWVDVVFSPTVAARTYSISGRITGGAATLTLSGASAATTTTDNNGAYSFSGLTSGTYVVAPSNAGFTFTPSMQPVSISDASVPSINFSASQIARARTVTLAWSASASPGVVGYNVYRAALAGGPYIKLNTSLLSSTTFIDSTVTGGKTYFYTATAVDKNNRESVYASHVKTDVPL